MTATAAAPVKPSGDTFRCHSDALRADSDRKEAILAMVAKHYGLTCQQLFTHTRQRRIAWPRQVAVYFLRLFTGYSAPEIGSIFCLDHGTVLYAVKRVADLAANTPSDQRDIDFLTSLLKKEFQIPLP